VDVGAARSLASFFVVAMVVIVSGAAMEVSEMRYWRCFWWQDSTEAVLSIPPLWCASASCWVVLCVGIICRYRVVPSALVSIVGLGSSR
jgi:hypothetical protein